MMAEEGDELSVRCLPEGVPHPGVHRGLRGPLLQVETAGGTDDLAAGTLVEVNCNETLYLGQVYQVENGLLSIGVEHILDSGSLDAIRKAWNRD